MEKTDINLPEPFVQKMRALMEPSGEWDAFYKSFLKPPVRGLRANKLKITAAKLKEFLDFETIPVPWCEDGLIYPETERPGKNWAYNAGLYYIQEPSAMCPAVVLDAKSGERILDLCAAPGGKSVQIAGMMEGCGVLVSNDASASRLKALVKNIEQLLGMTIDELMIKEGSQAEI